MGADRSLVDLTGREVHVVIDPHAGDASATVWTNDLTHDYVHENSAYSTRAAMTPAQTLRGAIDAAALRVAQAKATTLVEALPWLERFRGALVVVKYGGNAMVDDTSSRVRAGHRLPPVCRVAPRRRHGGGRRSRRCSIDWAWSVSSAGLRVTTPEVMDVVRMVLTGQVGRELVGLVNQHGPLAVGSPVRTPASSVGAARPWRSTVHPSTSASSVTSRPSTHRRPDILEAGRIPVVSTVAPDLDVPGQVLNVNADRGPALAAALGARKLVVPHRRRGGVCRVARPGFPPPRLSVSGARISSHASTRG